MASTTIALAAFVFAMLLFAEANLMNKDAGAEDRLLLEAERNRGGGGRLSPQSCSPACNYRCSNTQYRKPCLKYCNLCCQMCLCVPPGTYGNKQVCPCYNNMKNAKGGNKCP